MSKIKARNRLVADHLHGVETAKPESSSQYQPQAFVQDQNWRMPVTEAIYLLAHIYPSSWHSKTPVSGQLSYLNPAPVRYQICTWPQGVRGLCHRTCMLPYCLHRAQPCAASQISPETSLQRVSSDQIRAGSCAAMKPCQQIDHADGVQGRPPTLLVLLALRTQLPLHSLRTQVRLQLAP